MKKILQFFLWNDWTDVFGFTEKTEKLSTAEYVIALEIIQEANSIPHGFQSLLRHILIDSENKGLKKMWNPFFAKRTGQALKIIFQKALKNQYKKNTAPYIHYEKILRELRKSEIDYTNHKDCYSLYKKIEAVYAKRDQKDSDRMADLIDSWY